MTYRNVLVIVGLLIFPILLCAQVTINDSGDDADESAILDINASNKGLLLPRLVINDEFSQVSPVANPANGLIIYNTGSVNVPEGVYMWNSSEAEWVALVTSKDDIIQTLSSGAGGYVLQWGGELSGGSYAIFGEAADGKGNGGTAYKTRGYVPRTGTVTTITWSSESGNNNSVLDMIITTPTSSSTTSIPLTGAAGVIDLPAGITVDLGDYIEIRETGSTDPDHIGILLYID